MSISVEDALRGSSPIPLFPFLSPWHLCSFNIKQLPNLIEVAATIQHWMNFFFSLHLIFCEKSVAEFFKEGGIG